MHINKKQSLILLFLLYFLAGINHFIFPDFYLSVIPTWMPFPKECISLSGVVEIILAVSLFHPALQRLAAWGIVVMLFVFLIGVHIPMVFNWNGWSNTIWWLALVRLPVQLLLIRWAFRFTSGKKIVFSLNNSI